jgi:endonuclease/exonuclease/phosphatase family metal-dependent hydrolase
MFVRQDLLHHDLSRHYPALRAIRRRADLLRSPLFAAIGREIERVTAAVERADHAEARDHGRPLRIVAWNIQRGRCFPGLRKALLHDPVLRQADVLLLGEVDNGLARSGNRNVARELAEALSMSYAFGVSYLTLEDDFGENPERRESTLALAGCAVLSRVPIGAVENVDLPELRDKFSASEKRLGKKRALLCTLELSDGPLVVAACHLDSNASPAQRAQQLEVLLGRLEATGAPRQLGGGDLNTTTYDASATWPLLRDVAHKLFITGFDRTVEMYMEPERLYERPLFDVLEAHGFTTDGLNDRAQGTLLYDLNSPYAIQKARRKVGRLLTACLRRRLRRWNGVVPARLDWFFGQGVQPLHCGVVNPADDDGRPCSDHAAIYVDLAR